MIEVAGILFSVFSPSTKSRFFGFYVNGITFADGTKKPSPGGRCPAGADEGGPFCDLLHCSICKKADPHQSKIKDFCQLPPGEAFVAICRNAWYNIEKLPRLLCSPAITRKTRKRYDKNFVHLPWHYLNRCRKASIFHNKLHFVSDLLPIYYIL